MIDSIKTNQPINKAVSVARQNEATFGQTPATNQTNTPSYTAPIYSYPNAPIYEKPSATTHTSWFYVNDIHGKMTKMERIYNMSQQFDRFSPNTFSPFFEDVDDKDIAKFKVASGDIIIGTNEKNNKVAAKFLDWCGFQAITLGNHEFDVTNPERLAQLLEDTNAKVLAANIEITDKASSLCSKFQPSAIIEKNGEKFGIIGIAPSDMEFHVKPNPTLSIVKVQNLEETIKTVQKEADKLKAQGINKIILLSHSGNPNDKKIAKAVDGIDIIFGAHTHNLIKNIKEKENLLYSKSGEPVIITQAGKDAENIGMLNVDFDENGIIKRAQNNILETNLYNRPLYVKDSVEDIIGKPEIVGRVKSTVPAPKNKLIEDNPHGNFIADAVRSELNTDIALVNTGNIRGVFTEGAIDTRLLADITPFQDKMMILNISEKQLVDALKIGCKSMTNKAHMPGIMLVSGLKYTCNKKGDLLELEFVDKNGQVSKIDINNPSTEKKYTVAADDFIATGGNDYFPSNPNPEYLVTKFDHDKDFMVANYLRKQTEPIESKHDGRIKIVD